MASVTLESVADRFPAGTTVGAYLTVQRRAGAAPDGSSVTTSAVTTAGRLTFAELEAGERYVAYAQVGGEHRYVSFSTPAPNEERSSPLLVESRSVVIADAVYEDGNLVSWTEGGVAWEATYDADGNLLTQALA